MSRPAIGFVKSPNQALEQTRDSVLRYREPVGRELLNFVVRQQEAQSQSSVGVTTVECVETRWRATFTAERVASSATSNAFRSMWL